MSQLMTTGQELRIIVAGRNVGKSSWTQAYMLQYQEYLDQFTWCTEQFVDQFTWCTEQFVDQFTWCTEQFGVTSSDRWWYIDGEFKFVNSEDEVLFRLRWS
jgi:hypothetical protein